MSFSSPALEDQLTELAPTLLGYDAKKLDEAISTIGEMQGVQGVLVARHGFLVTERYWRGGDRNIPHNMKSASKSVISALTGIAISKGIFSLDDPVVTLLPKLTEEKDPAKRRITVRDLLQMTSGLASSSYQAYNVWVNTSDWVESAFKGKLEAPPGQRYAYSTANSHLLSAIIAQQSGMSTRLFAERYLFSPIGVDVFDWTVDPTGIHVGGNNLWIMPRDYIKFGQLFLNDGKWQTKQVVPAAWVTASVRPRGKTHHDDYGDYGFLWWTPFADGSFAAVGYGGQYIIVSPHNETVVVILSTHDSKGHFWESSLFSHLRKQLTASLISPETPLSSWTTARVNLRSSASPSGKVITVIPSGETIHFLTRNGDWLKVFTKDLFGWVHQDYIYASNELISARKSKKHQVEQATPVGIDIPVILSEQNFRQLTEQVHLLNKLANKRSPLPRYRVKRTVNFRYSPSLLGERIKLIQPDYEFQAEDRSGSWIMTSIDGVQGWLFNNFIEVIEQPSLKYQDQDIRDGVAALQILVKQFDQPAPSLASQGKGIHLQQRNKTSKDLVRLRQQEHDFQLLNTAQQEKIKNLQQQLNQRGNEEQDKNKQFDLLKKNLDEETAVNTRLKAEIEEKQSLVGKLEQINDLQQGQLETSKSAQSSIDVQLNKLQEQHAVVLVKADKEKSKSSKEYTELQQSFVGIKKQLEKTHQLKVSRNQLSVEVGHLKTDKQKLEIKQQELAALMKERQYDIDGLRQQLNKHRKKEQNKSKQLKLLRQNLDETTGSNIKLKDELDRFRKVDQINEQVNQENQQLIKTLSILRESTQMQGNYVIELTAQRDKLMADNQHQIEQLRELQKESLEKAIPSNVIVMKETISRQIAQWATDWESQDADRYLRNYDHGFVPEGGVTRTKWISNRRLRVTKSKAISVKISGLKIEVNNNRAKATFTQIYRANHYRDRMTKSLDFKRDKQGWKIIREYGH